MITLLSAPFLRSLFRVSQQRIFLMSRTRLLRIMALPPGVLSRKLQLRYPEPAKDMPGTTNSLTLLLTCHINLTSYGDHTAAGQIGPLRKLWCPSHSSVEALQYQGKFGGICFIMWLGQVCSWLIWRCHSTRSTRLRRLASSLTSFFMRETTLLTPL